MGTGNLRALAITGVVLGFLTGIIWGIIALLSYTGWRDGRLDYPRFAWFFAIHISTFLLFIILSLILSSLTNSTVAAMSVGPLVGLVFSLIAGFVGLYWLIRQNPKTPPRAA